MSVISRATRVALVALVLAVPLASLTMRPALAAQSAIDAQAPDWTVIRTVIGDQLEALRSGDAARAYSFASAGIQLQFHDPPTFVRMVRGSYSALLDARHTEFLEGAVLEGHVIQPLRLVMSDNTVLVALYEMVREEGGAWRIGGCVIAPSTVKSV